jgi:hypothetical protein
MIQLTLPIQLTLLIQLILPILPIQLIQLIQLILLILPILLTQLLLLILQRKMLEQSNGRIILFYFSLVSSWPMSIFSFRVNNLAVYLMKFLEIKEI